MATQKLQCGCQCAIVAPDEAPVEEFQWDQLEHPPRPVSHPLQKHPCLVLGWTKPITIGRPAHATNRRPQTLWPNRLAFQDGPHPKGGSRAKEWELCSFSRWPGHGHVQHPHIHHGFCTQSSSMPSRSGHCTWAPEHRSESLGRALQGRLQETSEKHKVQVRREHELVRASALMTGGSGSQVFRWLCVGCELGWRWAVGHPAQGSLSPMASVLLCLDGKTIEATHGMVP